jgi:hypothetical chaperone protein
MPLEEFVFKEVIVITITDDMAYAIDFGTSNSLLAVCNSNNEYEVLDLDTDNSDPKIFKTLIFTPSQKEWFFGANALNQYVEFSGEGRFFRSIKKFLPEENFSGTIIHNKQYSLSDIIATFLREMKKRADQIVGRGITKLMLGRPASYSDSDQKDKLAEDRMRTSAIAAGFVEIEFCPEPIAAAYGFRSKSNKSKLAVIADLGGGTSDFTIIKLDPGEFKREQVLGLGGIFVAGDAIDGSIMRNKICNYFGAKVKYSLPMGNRELSFPKWLLQKLSNPAHMAFLKEKKTNQFLKEIETFSIKDQDRESMKWLFTLIDEQLGHTLFKEIEKVKISLSNQEESKIIFKESCIDIVEMISNEQFRKYADHPLQRIKEVLLKTINDSEIDPHDIDLVCVTGGTGQVPMVKELLKGIFGDEKLSEHNHFKSVINGLGQYTCQNLL